MRMNGEDPEQRIAELERQVADARRIADLERQRAEARRAAQDQDRVDTPPTGFRALPRRNSPPGPRVQPAPLVSMNGGAFRPYGGTPQPDGFDHLDTRLADAPRRVPFVFWLAELIPFRWPYVFTIFIVATVGFSTLSWFYPVALPFIAVAAVAAVYAYQLTKTATRMALLKWGVVARVVSTGTRHNVVTWKNTPLPIARGWTVSRPVYSGPGTTTDIRYRVNDRQGTIRVSGREYVDGVVLADPRKPERALCVTSFTYDLDRDESGNWVGKLRTRLVVGMVSWAAMVALFLGVAFALAYYEHDVMSWVCDNANTRGIDCRQYE